MTFSQSDHAHFPTHTEPRVWLITAGDSPIGISVAREILAHGDCVLFGLSHSVENDETSGLPQPLRQAVGALMEEVAERSDQGWNLRFKAVSLDIRCAIEPRTSTKWSWNWFDSL